MRLRFAPFVLALLVAAIFGCQCVYFYPHLPDPMATHFGPNGQPNGWMPKATFVASFGAFLFFYTLIIGSAGMLIGLVPVEMVNLPNKDYWLAPERKAATLAILSSYMLSLACATSALMLCIAQAVFKANLAPEPNLDGGPWGLLSVFTVFLLIWTVLLIRRFRR